MDKILVNAKQTEGLSVIIHDREVLAPSGVLVEPSIEPMPENPVDTSPDNSTETVTPPPGQNFDLKTGLVSAIITFLTTSPIALKWLEGGELKEVAVFAGDLIKNNLWLFLLIGSIYLLRETIHGLAKQLTFWKVIDSVADPNKKSVEIKTN